MDKYNDLEMSILSCIYLKPELIENSILEDKYFIKHKKLWLFMKAFYKKFKTFDITLMCSVCKNQYKLLDYFILIADTEPTPYLFDYYVEELITKYNESKKDKWLREKIYSLASELYIRNIDFVQFNDKLDKIYKDSEKIFKE